MKHSPSLCLQQYSEIVFFQFDEQSAVAFYEADSIQVFMMTTLYACL